MTWRLLTIALVASTALASAQGKPRLSSADIDDITRLVTLEDKRQFDEPSLARMLKSGHPEVRRRAALAVGRIANPAGGALLVAARGDKNAEVAATVVFSTGQLKDPAAVPWLSDILSAPATPPDIAREAAISLGKIQTPESRAALTRYLLAAPTTAAAAPVVGEALLSMGRFTGRHDIGPILRWTKSSSADVRWRATWALVRPRDPAALPHLLRLSEDPSPDVRSWAVRGLTPPASSGRASPAAPPAADGPVFDRARTAARLREAVKDPDRRVRTEAVRALGQHDDDESFAVLLAALDSPDTWISVSAAEAMARYPKRAGVIVPRLRAAATGTKPIAMRLAVLTPLVTLSPEAALDLAGGLARDNNLVVRTAARQTLGRLGAPGQALLTVLPPTAATATSAPRAEPREPRPALTDADYRRIVERWIVPDYNGAPKPRAIWETPRGAIEIELHPGDAPLGVEHFVRAVESGEIAGTGFGRVVPNFVVQQRPIRNDITLRDEVNRHGLTRATVSWASSGLDTGRPGYTFGNTPQPHNEGNFTALGRVVAGMDAVDRLELADTVTAARMKK